MPRFSTVADSEFVGTRPPALDAERSVNDGKCVVAT
jgi:hypothetical protein